MKRTNKLSIPKILVAGANSALSTSPLVGATNALGVADGQLSVLSWDSNGTTALGTGLATGISNSAVGVSAIKVVQGTPASSNITLADNVFKVNDPAFVESGIINRDKIFSFAARKAKVPTYGAVSISNITATPVGNTQYGFYTELISQTNDRDYSDNDNVLSTVIETPDWGATALPTPSNTRDWVLQNLAANLNSRSKAVRSSYGTGSEDIIVIGIKVGGGSATGNGSNAATLGATIPGAVINVQTVNGIISTFTVDQAFVQTLAQLRTLDATTFAAASTFEIIDLSTAGNAAKIDALLVVGLPRTKSAYYDNVEQLYPNVKVNPGFAWQPTMVNSSQYVTSYRVAADDGTGQGWKLRNMNDLRNQLFVHTMQTQPMGEWFSQGKEYINESIYYNQYTLEYFDTENTINSEVVSPKQLTILIPASVTLPASTVTTVFGNTPAGYYAVAATNTEPIATLETTLGTWLKDCVAKGFSNIQLKGSATTSVYFTT